MVKSPKSISTVKIPVKHKMHLIINDFGPIDNADIYVADMTAIIGPNASGKTYVTNIINGLLNFSDKIHSSLSNYIFQAIVNNTDDDVTKNGVFTVVGSELPPSKVKEIIDFIKQHAKIHGDPSELYLSTTRRHFFLIPLPDIIRELSNNFEADLKELIKFDRKFSHIHAEFAGYEIDITIRREGDPEIEFNLRDEYLLDTIKGFNGTIYGSNGAGNYSSSGNGTQYSCALIPTERIAAMVSMPNIIDDIARSRGRQTLLINDNISNHTLTAKQTLVDLITYYLNAIRTLKTGGCVVSSKASHLISGDISIDKNLPFAPEYKIGEKTLPLNLISSGALQLIPLTIISESPMYKTLLIEEPEINLHANKHIEIAEYLWKLVNEMNKTVFISTHSDYLLIKMAHMSKGNQKKSINIYLLDEGHTTELKIDKEGEIEEIPTIGKAINDLLLKK